MKISDEFVLEFTTRQQQEIIQKCGFNPEAVKTSALSLIKFSLAASAAGSDSLPLVKHISTVERFFDRQKSFGKENEIYFIELKLTPKQRSKIQSVVGKGWKSVMFFPDEHENIFIEEWEDDLFIKRVGKSFVIVPEKIKYVPLPGENVILLHHQTVQPDQTFGKGNHGATQAVIELMETYGKHAITTLDVGTGTGVLAVAAAKLGSKHITAIDINAEAVRSARKTLTINELEDKVEIREESIDGVKGVFDLVLANLFPRIIISLASQFSQKVKYGGLLIVSGLTVPRMSGIIKTLESVGFKYVDSVIIRNWSAIILKKSENR